MDPVPGNSQDENDQFSRKELFILMKDHLKSDLQIIIENLESRLSSKSGRIVQVPEDMKPNIAKLFHSMRTKYQEANRKEDTFFYNLNDWLSVMVSFPITLNTAKISVKQKGRHSAEFSSLSESSKRRRTSDLRTKYDDDELSFAAQMSLRSAGKLSSSKVVKDVSSSSPSKADKYIKGVTSKSSDTNIFTSDEALSLFLDMALSRRKYQMLRNSAVKKGCKLYPPYADVLNAKRQCYPDRDKITISESKAEEELQALLDHTTQRILLLQRNVINEMSAKTVRNMEFICKWGFDGTCCTTYKMKFANESISDANLLLTSLVPLQMFCADKNSETTKVLWSNPKPSSTRFCRPVKLEFIQETSETSMKEISYYDQQIKALKPCEKVLEGKEVSISYKLAMTMVDGKVCNAVTSTKSTQRCYLCNATSKGFNNIDLMFTKPIKMENLQYGLSTLHAWIRCFECCLHVGYKLGTKKWQTRGDEDKKELEMRKAAIQKGFKTELGLLVDVPKQGFGSSNDGNTARRFFEQSKVSSLITGVDENLINRFHAVLQAMSSGCEIDVDKFREYAVETARLFVRLYPWYYMPTTVHKILIHGPEIIAKALLPLGQLSEEAQESTNKLIRRYREDFSRKFFRVATMEDVFLRLLATSDPYISTLRQEPPKTTKKLTEDAQQLLIMPGALSEDSTESSDEISDDDM